MRGKLSASDAKWAKEMYLVFFKRHWQKNPTDLNTREKFEYAREISWDNYSLMQLARKSHTKKNGWPYPWTHRDWWAGKIRH